MARSQEHQSASPKQLAKFLIPLVAAIAIALVALPGIVQPTWMPAFNPDRIVYVDPKLTQNSTSPVNLNGLQAQIQAASTQHDLAVYVVAAQQGLDARLPATNWAIVKLNELAARWRKHPEFPGENYLIVFWIRRSDNVNKGWVAANVGDQLRQQGITAERLSAANGPVILALKQYMPDNPQRALLGVINNIDRDLDRYQQRVAEVEAQIKRNAERQQQRQQQADETVAISAEQAGIFAASLQPTVPFRENLERENLENARLSLGQAPTWEIVLLLVVGIGLVTFLCILVWAAIRHSSRGGSYSRYDSDDNDDWDDSNWDDSDWGSDDGGSSDYGGHDSGGGGY